jgi:hypothetical protein
MKISRLNNLTDLANLLRSIDNSPESELGFDMHANFQFANDSKHPCGSACCIGGWIQACNVELQDSELEEAVQALQPNLDIDECYLLCSPKPFSKAWNATPEQAARAVEILRDTGVCDWETAMKGTQA